MQGGGAAASSAELDRRARRPLFSAMFRAEALRLSQILLSQQEISPLLNLGSSTGPFREVTKPHIEALLFAALRAAGVRVLHSDLKAGEGVDVVGDLLDPQVFGRLKAHQFRCVLLSNVLEHVRDRAAVAAACEALVGPGGLVLASAPSSCPFHADPIDTGFRPTPQALAQVFAGSDVLLAEEVAGPTYAEDFRARGSSLLRELGRTAVGALLAVVRPKSFLGRAHRWFWYGRPRRAAIALVRVR